jgi:hypothetical protein
MSGGKRNSDEDMTQYESNNVLHGAVDLLQVECRVDGSGGMSTRRLVVALGLFVIVGLADELLLGEGSGAEEGETGGQCAESEAHGPGDGGKAGLGREDLGVDHPRGRWCRRPCGAGCSR